MHQAYVVILCGTVILCGSASLSLLESVMPREGLSPRTSSCMSPNGRSVGYVQSSIPKLCNESNRRRQGNVNCAAPSLTPVQEFKLTVSFRWHCILFSIGFQPILDHAITRSTELMRWWKSKRLQSEICGMEIRDKQEISWQWVNSPKSIWNCRIPDLDRPIIRSARHPTVAEHCQGTHVVCMWPLSLKRRHARACVQLPDLDRAIQGSTR